MRAGLLVLVAVLFALGVASEVEAGCTLTQEAGKVRKSISRDVRCNDKRFRKGPTAECSLAAPPACAGTLVHDAVALAYGPNDPPAAAVDTKALRDQRNCQKSIGNGVARYVHTKLRGLIRSVDLVKLEAKARRQLDRMPDRCVVDVLQDVSGVLAPAVGPQCAAAVDGAVDAPALRDCLITLLSVWVDRWGPNPEPLRPNIVFILTDDQRWDTTDATHSLDGVSNVMARTRAELADDGVELTEAFMTTPLCCPSRSGILSGQYAHRNGVYKNGGNNGGADDFEFDEMGGPGISAEALPVWLQSAGYRTGLIGKYLNGYAQLWDNGEPPYVPPGWTEWRGMKNVAFFDYVIVEPDGMGGYVENSYGSAEADYSTDVLREKAKTFISDSVAAGEPFFLYLSFKAPHLPQTPAPRHDGMFEGVMDWRPPSYNVVEADKPTWMQMLPPQDSDDLDQVRIDQLEMVQAVDEAIGGNPAYGIVGIMEHLRNLGIADDTMVVYFSDNGWLWGEHSLRAKNQPYEESIRSPMMVRYPKLVPLPRVETRFALNIDLAPTFAELAGVGVPILHDGVSLVGVLDGTQPAGTWRTDFLAEAWPGSHPWALVREEQWKYTEIALDPGNPATTFDVELYDVINDPYEQDNVADVNPVQAAAMAVRLRQLRPNWPIDSDPNGPDPAEDE
jgi:arylsulfatase A-like enzyme